MKKDGGTVKNWQLHTLSGHYEGTLGKILTGTLVNDPTGRFQPGFHIRTSLVVSVTGNRVETMNTVYHLHGPSGDVFGDMGDAVLGIYY